MRLIWDNPCAVTFNLLDAAAQVLAHLTGETHEIIRDKQSSPDILLVIGCPQGALFISLKLLCHWQSECYPVKRNLHANTFCPHSKTLTNWSILMSPNLLSYINLIVCYYDKRIQQIFLTNGWVMSNHLFQDLNPFIHVLGRWCKLWSLSRKSCGTLQLSNHVSPLSMVYSQSLLTCLTSTVCFQSWLQQVFKIWRIISICKICFQVQRTSEQ